MKKALSLILVLIMTTVLLSSCGSSGTTSQTPAGSSSQAPAQPGSQAPAGDPSAEITEDYVIRVAYDFLGESYLGQSFTKFSDRVTELSGGKITFNIHGSGSLYTADQALEAVMAGDLEMCVVANSNIGNYCPAMLVISLPFMIPNLEAMEAMLDPQGELLQSAGADLGSKNLEILDIFAFVVTDISSNKQIKVPTDMGGMKIRVYGQTNSTYTDLSSGASVFLSGGEVVQALSANTIDGAWCGVESMVTRKYYEFQDYVVACGAERSDQPVVMCKSWWDGLPANVQSIIRQAMDETITEQHAGSYEVGEEARKALADNGVDVYYPTDAEMQEWYAVADKVYESFYDTVGEDLIKQAVAIRDQYA